MTLLATIAAGLVVAAASALFARWLSGKAQRAADNARERAMQDAILGSGEVRDLGGGIIAIAEPGLVARVGGVESAVTTLESAVTTLAEVVANQKELHDLFLTEQRERVMLGVRVTSLERHSEERTEMHRETTALLNTIAERDTVTGETDS